MQIIRREICSFYTFSQKGDSQFCPFFNRFWAHFSIDYKFLFLVRLLDPFLNKLEPPFSLLSERLDDLRSITVREEAL